MPGKSKKKKSNGFWWGLLLGAIIGAAGCYLYIQKYGRSELDRSANKIESKAKKEFERAEKGIKKLLP